MEPSAPMDGNESSRSHSHSSSSSGTFAGLQRFVKTDRMKAAILAILEDLSNVWGPDRPRLHAMVDPKVTELTVEQLQWIVHVHNSVFSSKSRRPRLHLFELVQGSRLIVRVPEPRRVMDPAVKARWQANVENRQYLRMVDHLYGKDATSTPAEEYASVSSQAGVGGNVAITAVCVAFVAYWFGAESYGTAVGAALAALAGAAMLFVEMVLFVIRGSRAGRATD